MARMSYRLRSTRWPWFVAATLLPVLWHGVESTFWPHSHVPTPLRSPCPSEVALGRMHGLMSTPAPKVPYPNWKRPPCDDPEVEHNGACWILPARADGGIPSPPCPATLWEYKGRCWKPVGREQRPGTVIGR